MNTAIGKVTRKLTVTKTFDNLKAAHRQWRHPGHCSYGHGENWSFDIMFEADQVDEQNFVVDFGKFSSLRDSLNSWFDHTFLIDGDDPATETFEELHQKRLINLRRCPYGCSAEGLAQQVFDLAKLFAASVDKGERNLRPVLVVCREDSKNSAMYAKAFEPV